VKPPANEFRDSSNNYLSFLSWCLHHERNQVYEHYWKEGFLGRALLFLIDKIITACECSFQLMLAQKRQSQSDSTHDEQQVINKLSNSQITSYDMVKIERKKIVKALKKLLDDTLLLKQEL
jgi:hypothetical protein